MRRLLLGSVALAILVGTGSVWAADLPPPIAPSYKAPVVAPVFSWTGFYIGADGGYAWGNSSGTLANRTGTDPVPYSFNANGPLAGGFAGGNYQMGAVVLGVEADLQWSNLTGNSGAIAAPSGTYTVSSKVQDYGSVRGRLGFAVDHWLFFGTGGWAFGGWSTSYAHTGETPFFTNNASSANGWTVGAGVEYAFTNNLIGRVEYRYTNLGPVSYVDPPSNSSELGNKITINDVRAGLSFKFGGPY
jgi:outer membrane immunogenic protein